MSVTPNTSPVRIDGDTIERAFRGRLSGLDFVRAVAVSLVFLGHATEGRVAYVWLVGGLGSITLFVVSGFLITWLLLREHAVRDQVDLPGFYRRRAARLLPALYLYLALAVGLQIIGERPVPWEPVTASVLYLTNYYQAFTGAETNLVSHLWALAMQGQFYLLWPAVAVALLKRGHRLSRVLAGAVVAVWCWRWLLIASGNEVVEYLYRALETRGDALAVGGLLAMAVRSDRWRPRLAVLVSRPGLGWMTLVLLFVLNGIGMQNNTVRFAGVLLLEPLLIALLVVVVVLSTRDSGILARMANSRIAGHLGKVSYGFYLFHGLIGYTTVRVVDQYTGSLLLAVAAAFVAIVVFATASYQYFEAPLRRWMTRESGTALLTPGESRATA